LKKLVTFRLDTELLARAKGKADLENRTLTNFVETVLKKAVEGRPGREEQATEAPAGRRPQPHGIHGTGATD
jgi:hypothetical protein